MKIQRMKMKMKGCKIYEAVKIIRLKKNYEAYKNMRL